MFYFLLVACLQFVLSIRDVQKETTLNAQTSSLNGAIVFHNQHTVAISGTTYKITVESQQEYDIRLSLNKSWGFKSFMASTISLTLDGETPSPDRDTDLLLVFSVNDWQYFSVFIHLDDVNNIKARIYPSIATQNITRLVSEWISDITYFRWQRISNNNQWISVNFKKQSLWPLKFDITNDPINNKTHFEFYHNSSVSSVVQYTFNTAFVCDQVMDIYLMGDSLTEKFSISSFNIQLLHETVTNPPTENTHSPSIYPTITPLTFTTKDSSATTSIAPLVSQTATDSITTLLESVHTLNTEVTHQTHVTYHETVADSVVLTIDDMELDGIYLSAEQKVATTAISDVNIVSLYTTEYISFREPLYSQIWMRFKSIIFFVIPCIMILLCGCFVKIYRKKTAVRNPYLVNAKSHSIMPRNARYSCDEGRQTPPSNVDDEMDLIHEMDDEQIVEIVDNNSYYVEPQEEQMTATSYGEDNNLLAPDEFIINGESTDGVYGNEAENEILVDHDGINGEYDHYDEEGNEFEEYDGGNEEEQTNQYNVTKSGDYANIASDEFIVMSDGDDAELTLRNNNDIV